MSEFYDRYKSACLANGIDPCSQTTAEKFGITRSAIGSWSSKGIIPKGETVARIANVLHVSADYLLARTDIPVDCSVYNNLSPDMALLLQKSESLNSTGLQRLDAYLDGLLESDSYRKSDC